MLYRVLGGEVELLEMGSSAGLQLRSVGVRQVSQAGQRSQQLVLPGPGQSRQHALRAVRAAGVPSDGLSTPTGSPTGTRIKLSDCTHTARSEQRLEEKREIMTKKMTYVVPFRRPVCKRRSKGRTDLLR